MKKILESRIEESIPAGMPMEVFDVLKNARFSNLRRLRDVESDQTVNGGLRNGYLADYMGKKVVVKLDKRCSDIDNPRLVRLLEKQNTRKEVDLFLERINKHPHRGLSKIEFTYDFQIDGAIYTVSAERYIENTQTLDSYVKRNYVIDRDVMDISKQLIDIVDHLNNKVKVLQRDLKPSNVLIRKINRRCEVFVVDYANGKGIEEETNLYMPSHGGKSVTDPTLTQERSSYDAQSEVYSLGATLNYVLTGEFPITTEIVDEEKKTVFETKTGISLIDEKGRLDTKGIEDAINESLKDLKGAKKRLSNVVRKAMSPNKETRYKNVRKMKEDIERIKDGTIFFDGITKYAKNALKTLMLPITLPPVMIRYASRYRFIALPAAALAVTYATAHNDFALPRKAADVLVNLINTEKQEDPQYKGRVNNGKYSREYHGLMWDVLRNEVRFKVQLSDIKPEMRDVYLRIEAQQRCNKVKD